MRFQLFFFFFTIFLGYSKAQSTNNDSLTIEYWDSVYYQNTFSLDDNKFEVGQIYQVKPMIIFEYFQYDIHKMSIHILDSLAVFLINHPNLKVEVGRHHDESEFHKVMSRTPTRKRAKVICEELIARGVDSIQLVDRGYSYQQPVIPIRSIMHMKSKRIQELAHQRNRRTELKILEIHKVLISGKLTCDNTDIPVTMGKVLYKNIKGDFGEVEADSTGHFELFCEPVLTSLQATSDETNEVQFGTAQRKYFASDKMIVDLALYRKDTLINISVPLMMYCGFNLRINFKNNSTKSEEFKGQIQQIIALMKDNPAIQKLEIRGYTTPDENPKLQAKRAKKVLKAFLKGGFPKDNISINNNHSNEPIEHPSYGCDGQHKTEPANSPLNSRVDFIILEIE